VDIVMPANSTTINVTTCAGHFVDDGRDANYSNNAIGTVVIRPATPGTKTRVIFNSFTTETFSFSIPVIKFFYSILEMQFFIFF